MGKWYKVALFSVFLVMGISGCAKEAVQEEKEILQETVTPTSKPTPTHKPSPTPTLSPTPTPMPIDNAKKIVTGAPVPKWRGERMAKYENTILWMNATRAVLAEINQRSHERFGEFVQGKEGKEKAQEILSESWNVFDRKTAIDNLEWIWEEGHRTVFLSDMQFFEEHGAGLYSEEEIPEFIRTFYEDEKDVTYWTNIYLKYRNGQTAIDAWDYSRTMSLLGWYYTAGYFSEKEALDKSLEMAQIIQQQYSSWDEYWEEYLFGYEYWSGGSSNARRKIYEILKQRENGPFSLEWDTPLGDIWSGEE